MKLKINKINCLQKDLVVPKGYRIIKVWEVAKEIETNKKLEKICKKDWIWAINYKGKINVCRLGSRDDDSDFVALDSSVNFTNDSFRGVFVKK